MKKKQPKVTLGGMFIEEWPTQDDGTPDPLWDTQYGDLGYIWIDFGNESMQVFYNRETRLLVVDVTKGDYGNEFVRKTVPTINTRGYAASFRRTAITGEEDE